MAKKDLVQVIRDNPGCIFRIDNDSWTCHHPLPKPEADMTSEEWTAWTNSDLLARDGDVLRRGDGGYGTGCLYGGDVLQALAVIAGVKIESV